MPESQPLGSPLSLFLFREVRGYLRRSHAIAMTATFAILYALGSMVVGGMLYFGHFNGGYEVLVLWGNDLGTTPWYYPGLLVVAPWGVVTLPFFATLSMVVVSIGVGIGMAVAVLLVVALLRARRSAEGRAASVGSVAGLTPAMIALVTLGACCSVTAAATAGVGIVASVSGSSTDNLLLNNWYLGVFQMVVVWVALLAQELVLRVYGGLFAPKHAGTPAPGPAPALTGRFVVGNLLRGALLVGGITWSLALLVEWTTTGPLGAGPAVWFRWLVEHLVPGIFAVVVALVPWTVVDFFERLGTTLSARLLRVALVVAGVSLAIGTPPPVAGWGAEGLLNEVLGVAGAPAAWGAVAPVFPPGFDLYFRWLVQYLLLGGFALLVGLAPARAVRPLSWTIAPPAASRAMQEPYPVEEAPSAAVNAAAESP